MVLLAHDARPVSSGRAAAPLLGIGAALIVCLAFLYAPLWSVCWKEWWRPESAYTHGILIPPLAFLMGWHRRREWLNLVPRPALTGLLLVLPGLALQLFAHWAHSTMLSWASFLVLVPGAIAFVAGWTIAVRLLPPLLFLTFMVPMSAMLTQPVVFGAQMVSTRVAADFLRVMGFQVHQMGTFLQMENYTLQVALPCSGFKTLIALSAFAACFVYLLQGSLPKKLLLFSTAMLLSVVVNGMRISLVGLTGELISSAAATWVHDNGGLPVTALALGGLFLMARMLKCPLAAPGS